MSRTPIQVPLELRDQLEGLKGRFYAKSLPDVIEMLIHQLKAYDAHKEEVKKKNEAENKRKELEDVHLGEELKKQFAEFQQHVGLRRPADAIEFLIANFDGSLSMNRMAFDTYVRLRG